MRRKSVIQQKIWDLRLLQEEYESRDDFEGRDRVIAMIVALDWVLGESLENLEAGKNCRIVG